MTEARTARARAASRASVQGVGFRPFVHRLASRARLRRLGAQRHPRRAARGRGRASRAGALPARARRARRRPWPRSSGCARAAAGDRRAAASRSWQQHASARAGAARAGLARRRALRGVPARRCCDPARPPPPLPVHQLHRLRAALHDRARRPVRPPARRRWRRSRCAPTACASTRTRRPPLSRAAERLPGVRPVGCG